MRSYLLYIPKTIKNNNHFLWLFKTAVLALNLKNISVDNEEKNDCEVVTYDPQKFNSQLSDANLLSLIQDKEIIFNNEGVILYKEQEDELMTAFYLINSLQEYGSDYKDNIGRFQYDYSWQKQFRHIDQNFVVMLFERFFLKHFPKLLENRVFEKSRFFVSHDIDSLYGAFLQDGLAAVKNGRIDIIAKLVFNAILMKPEWFNIDKILKIENEYDLKSTFFWIVNKGRVSKTLVNSDYNIDSSKLKNTLNSVITNKSYIGLHKSISGDSFDEEISKLGHPVTINRNHYLKFDLPTHYQSVERSSLKIDCSLGFAEHYGFRNSLAIPFVPFDISAEKPYHFLEVPLNIMDGTFQKYMKLTPEETSKHILEFVEKNKTNSVLSVLWHNHFFNSYRFGSYFEPYITLLDYIKENKFNFITPESLYSEYYITS